MLIETKRWPGWYLKMDANGTVHSVKGNINSQNQWHFKSISEKRYSATGPNLKQASYACINQKLLVRSRITSKIWSDAGSYAT